MHPCYPEHWTGLRPCNHANNESCILQSGTDPFKLFEIGNLNREQDSESRSYIKNKEDCIASMSTNGLIHRADAVSFYMKRMDAHGKLFWGHGDSSTKYIEIELIDDDIYEETERIDIELSIFKHPNYEFNPTLSQTNQFATIYIEGPNDGTHC